MKKLSLFIGTIVIALGGATLALGHNAHPTNDCDTWSRTTHYPSPSATPTPSHHRTGPHTGAVNYDNLKDFNSNLPDTPLPNATLIHTSGGHYVAETGNGTGSNNVAKGTYVEVVGGQQYEGEPYVQNAGEGGYVQGRIDGANTPATGHHVDFHFNSFGPLSEGSNALTWDTHAEVCVSVDNTKVQQKQHIPCPVPSSAPDGVKCY